MTCSSFYHLDYPCYIYGLRNVNEYLLLSNDAHKCLPYREKNLNIIFEKRSSTTSKQNIHINYQRTRLCDLQIFLSMYFVYGLKTLKNCLAICSSNITPKAAHGSFCIKKNRSYRDKIFTTIIRNFYWSYNQW